MRGRTSESSFGPIEQAGWGRALNPLRRVRTDPWAPAELDLFTTHTGDMSAIIGCGAMRSPLRASGRFFRDTERARLVAAAEGLERYASTIYADKDLVVASERDLGTDALSLASVARCSRRELMHPACPVHSPWPVSRIRWVEGVDLFSGKDAYVPAVMTYLHFAATPEEQFWLQISTGCAVQTSYAAAISSAICEIIERDAVSLLWLQKLPLPLIGSGCLADDASSMISWCDSNFIDTDIFDATTDIGIPTAYCLQTTRYGKYGAQIVGSATDIDPKRAVSRAVTECVGIRGGIAARRAIPRRYSAYTDVTDGATLMALRTQRRCFGFLLDDLVNRPTRTPPKADDPHSEDDLAVLLKALGSHELNTYCVDITTQELEAVGLVAVRVLIPQLQPMSLRPLAQYRAHPRLYSAPRQMGYSVRSESRLNRWPQPVA